MVQKNYIALEKPTGVELAGIKCYVFTEGKIYEQIKKPQGNQWEAAESSVVLSGQKLADFLFGRLENSSIDLSGTILASPVVSDPIPLIIALG